METIVQQATRINLQKHQNEQGKLGAFAGKVVTVAPLDDQFYLSFGAAPSRVMPVQHPFSGENSWLRSMPEVGAVYLMQNRFDTGQPEALKTIPAFTATRAQDYQNSLNVYRALQPGEHDIVSNGFAMAYFSQRGNLDLRSGASVKMQLDQDNQETRLQSPTIKRNLLFNTLGMMGDEERIGIVKRWTDAATEFYVKTDDGNDNFVSEHYLQLTNPAKEGPVVLLQRIEGQVYDEDGDVLNHTTTALPLRSQALWYTTTDEFLSREIDQNGNMLFNFPSTASTGFEIQIPNGSFRQVIGVDRDVTIDGDERVVVQQNIHYTVSDDVLYDVTGNYTINSGANALLMDVTEGSEAVSLLNSAGLGIQATNAGGGALNLIGPSGSSFNIASSGAATLAAKQTLNLTVDQSMTFSGQVLNANFDSINLGKGAAIPAVLGLTLQTYLDMHFHTSTAPGDPTSPPVIPSASFNGTPQSILSIKILLAGNT